MDTPNATTMSWHKALSCQTCAGFVPHEQLRKRIVLKVRRNLTSICNGSRNHCHLPRRWVSAPLVLCSGYHRTNMLWRELVARFYMPWDGGPPACWCSWVFVPMIAQQYWAAALRKPHWRWPMVTARICLVWRVQTKPVFAYYVILRE